MIVIEDIYEVNITPSYDSKQQAEITVRFRDGEMTRIFEYQNMVIEAPDELNSIIEDTKRYIETRRVVILVCITNHNKKAIIKFFKRNED